MNLDQIQVEEDAYESVKVVLAAARRCQELYERAGLVLPQRVQWLLGVAPPPAAVRGEARGVAQLPPPELPDRPKTAASDWIAVPAADGTVTTVALAVLRVAGGPMRSRDVRESVMNILPATTSGSVANAGTRLVAEEVIDRSNDGWILLKPERAPILQDGRLWGPPDIFVKQEVAAHRREAILHILTHFPTGLQIVQIVEQLKNCTWLHAPTNKDLVKMDMQALQELQKVRRVGNAKKWQLVPAEKAE
jgi:hypothetical protein